MKKVEHHVLVFIFHYFLNVLIQKLIKDKQIKQVSHKYLVVIVNLQF